MFSCHAISVTSIPWYVRLFTFLFLNTLCLFFRLILETFLTQAAFIWKVCWFYSSSYNLCFPEFPESVVIRAFSAMPLYWQSHFLSSVLSLSLQKGSAKCVFPTNYKTMLLVYVVSMVTETHATTPRLLEQPHSGKIGTCTPLAPWKFPHWT